MLFVEKLLWFDKLRKGVPQSILAAENAARQFFLLSTKPSKKGANRVRLTPLLTVAMMLIAGPLLAGEADVTDVTVVKTAPHVYDFTVTVRHDDSGWEHYADKWEVLDLNHNVLAIRILYHPHVDEQPFTRSLSAVKIPTAVRNVNLRAHCSVHGYGGQEYPVDLPQ